MKRLLGPFGLLLTVGSALAQDATASPDSTDNAAAAAGVVAGCGIFGFFWLVSVGLWIAAAIWVMRDAKRRNSPNATLVTVLTWIPFTWVIGLIVHLVTRPKTTPSGQP